MQQLRPHPDLDQLRRQARELLRAAKAGDQGAIAKVRAAAGSITLVAAQHALAREYGYESWPKLKDAVDQRLSAAPKFLLRYVRSPEELRELWAAQLRIR